MVNIHLTLGPIVETKHTHTYTHSAIVCAVSSMEEEDVSNVY